MDELTTKMHGEFIKHEISDIDLRVMGVFGALRSGVSLQDALIKYNLTEIEYGSNIDRVLSA